MYYHRFGLERVPESRRLSFSYLLKKRIFPILLQYGIFNPSLNINIDINATQNKYIPSFELVIKGLIYAKIEDEPEDRNQEIVLEKRLVGSRIRFSPPIFHSQDLSLLFKIIELKIREVCERDLKETIEQLPITLEKLQEILSRYKTYPSTIKIRREIDL